MLTIVVYLPALSAGYIWDDDSYLTENRLLDSVQGLGRIWTEPSASPQYYPVTFTSFFVEKRLWGLDPIGFHLVSVLLHAASAFLLLKILTRLKIPGAFFAAAVFAAHPLFVESVAWVTERKNTLSGMFCLLSFLYLLKWRDEDETPDNHYIKAFVFFLLSLLSKTVSSVMPAAFLVAAWFSGRKITKDMILKLLPFFAAGIMFGILTGYIEYNHVGARGPESEIPFANRVMTAGYVFWFYLKRIVFPVSFCFNYPQFHPDTASFALWIFPVSAALLPAVLFALRKKLGKGPLATVLLYGGTVFPALGFVDVYPFRYSVTADHFCYLPAVFPVIFTAGILSRLPKKFFFAVTASVIAVLGVTAHQHASVFLNRETLYRATIKCNPQSWFANRKLAEVYAAQGRYSEALAALNRALEIRPEDADVPDLKAAAFADLGTMLLNFGRYGDAGDFLRRALELSPRYPMALMNQGAVFQAEGKLRESAESYLSALRLDPNYTQAAFKLLDLEHVLNINGQRSLGQAKDEYETGRHHLLWGRKKAAQESFGRAAEASPESAPVQRDFGALLLDLGRPGEAIAHLRKAVESNPLDIEAKMNLARAFEAMGDSVAASSAQRKYCFLLESLARSELLTAEDLRERGKTKQAGPHEDRGTRLRDEYFRQALTDARCNIKAR